MRRSLLALCAAIAMPAAAAETFVEKTVQPFTGDLDAIIERRVIRALVPPSRTEYWIERGKPTGSQYELLAQFENELNRRHRLKGKHLRLHVSFVPTARNQLIPALLAGKGDIAAGINTVTPGRQAQVDFADPFYRDVAEMVVTGPSSPPLATIDDLSGKQIFVQRSSSYWTHLEALNQRFASEGKPAVELQAAPEDLLDDDLLEMVDAGLVGLIVVDRYVGRLWSKIFKRLRPREDILVHQGGEIAWMVRKDNPQLKAELSRFAKKFGQGSGFGNVLVKKYSANARFVQRATTPKELKKFQQLSAIFKKYGERYDLDYLLMMAQGYQESRLDQDAKSAVGAIGVMQVMPATGKEMKTGDIHKLEPNIHAGVKYIRFVQDRYFEGLPMDPIDKTLFTFAAYNCGPGRVRQLRARAEKKGLDPNKWLKNVELVAAEKIGPETVTYVSSIYKYYVAYKLMADLQEGRQRSIEGMR